jgi:hypothetical protein
MVVTLSREALNTETSATVMKLTPMTITVLAEIRAYCVDTMIAIITAMLAITATFRRLRSSRNLRDVSSRGSRFDCGRKNFTAAHFGRAVDEFFDRLQDLRIRVLFVGLRRLL